ncbi:MAG: metal-dependent hydrolase [Planctomycetaceae bacterium]|nr:metal-dependent hydrolase [Planctomycetaceae bacterium]
MPFLFSAKFAIIRCVLYDVLTAQRYAMGNFRQHLTTSTLTGAVYGVTGAVCGLPTTSCLLAGGGCSLAGLLPDIDSNSSRSFQECIYLAAGVTAMLCANRLKEFPINPEVVTLVGVGVFLFVRFVIGTVICKVTSHRGMCHSIPAAIIATEIAFLISTGSVEIRIFKAFGLFCGFISHLILDEIFSIDLQGHRIKKSFGTALKFFDPKSTTTTVFVYGTLVALLLVTTQEPQLTQSLVLPSVRTAPEYAWADSDDKPDQKNSEPASFIKKSRSMLIQETPVDTQSENVKEAVNAVANAVVNESEVVSQPLPQQGYKVQSQTPPQPKTQPTDSREHLLTTTEQQPIIPSDPEPTMVSIRPMTAINNLEQATPTEVIQMPSIGTVPMLPQRPAF